MSNIDALAAAWLDAKRAENKAKDERLTIEAQLCEALDHPTEGSKTHKIENHKVTLTGKMTRKLDRDEWNKVRGQIDANLHPVKVKLEVDDRGVKYLAANEPELWGQIASAFETKPAKTAVKVEAI